MASHHHQCHPSTTTTTSAVCNRSYCCPNYTPSHHPPFPDSHPFYHHPPQTNFYAPYPNGPNPNPPYTHQNLHHQPPQHHLHPTEFENESYFQQLRHHQQQGELTHNHPVVSSLLRRIAALESSLRRRSSSQSHSLRDAAARTIQAHFRAFLVRRSRTLRQLKDLASMKSSLNNLKSSVSENARFGPQSISRKALKLLLKLDSIQGGDPMIRDGKKTISRELNRFMDLIDDFNLKRFELSARLVKKNVTKKSGGSYSDPKRGIVGTRDLGKNQRLEDLVHRIDALYTKVPVEDDDEEEDVEYPGISIIERNAVSRNRTGSLAKRQDGVEAKSKKSVSFVENGKVYKVHRRYEPASSADSDSDDESNSVGAKAELEEYVHRKGEKVGRISNSLNKTEDDEESTKSSDAEGSPVYELSEDGSFTFSAPLPVKMETRTEMLDKRKTLKIVE